jgi:hypothetical protein
MAGLRDLLLRHLRQGSRRSFSISLPRPRCGKPDQSAGLFLNSSFGIGPEFSQSGLEGPSIFPNTSIEGRFAVKPIEGIVLRPAVLGGVPVDQPNGSRQVFAKDDGLIW